MIFELLFNNSTLIVLLFMTFYIFLFYAFGAVLQQYFSFKKSNKYLSIPLGMFTYLFVTMIVYSPLIFFRLDRIWFIGIELLKDTSILFIIILYYRAWIPDYKSYSSRTFITLPLGILSIVAGLLVFFLLKDFTSISHPVNESFNLAMNKLIAEDLGSGEFFFNTLDIENPLSTVERYESLYYWMSVKEISLESVGPNFFIQYLMPLLMITSLSSAILGTVVDSERSFVSFAVALVIITLSSVIEWYIGPSNELFYIMPIIITSVLLLCNYSYQRIPHDSTLFVLMFLLFTLQSITYWAIPILILFGTAGLAMCIEKRGQIGRTMLVFLSMVAISVITFSVLMLPKQLANVGGNFVLTFALILILFGLIITPLYSLANSNSRRSDLVSFETKSYKRRNLNLIIISIVLLIISIAIIYLVGKHSLEETINAFLLSISDKEWKGLLIYSLTLLAPSIIIFMINWKYNYSSILTTIPYLTFIFNPFTLSLIFQTSGWEMNWIIIFVPQITIFSLWGLTESLKLIPEEIRL